MLQSVSDVSGDPSWDEYRRRRRAFRFALILFPLWIVPGALIQDFLAGCGFNAISLVTFLAVVVPPLACVAVVYLRWIFWLCPQCGWPFRLTWLGVHWFTRRCVHCGLPMWGVPEKMKGKSLIFDEF
jgi:hypothetical protein